MIYITSYVSFLTHKLLLQKKSLIFLFSRIRKSNLQDYFFKKYQNSLKKLTLTNSKIFSLKLQNYQRTTLISKNLKKKIYEKTLIY